MARTALCPRPRRRRRRSYHMENELRGECFDGDDSEGNTLSSGVDGLDIVARDRFLDDVLFGFFREQSVKTLKRNYSDFFKDFDLPASIKDKRRRLDGFDRSVYTKYSLKYYLSVIRKLTQQQRSVIDKFGFGCLLLLDLHEIPSDFSRWVADCIDPVCSQITVHCSTIDISKRTVHVILGVPYGGLEIEYNSKEGEDFILGHFQLTSMPHITFFGNKLSGVDELSDHDVFLCFMCIAIHCFLCPSSKDYISGKYLSVLKNPEATRGYDFSKLVYDHCLSSINEFLMVGKLNGRRLRAPACCNYVPVVRYLDCLDFGRQNVDQSFPRISVWKGQMIKVFSNLDRKGRNKYGKRPLKEGFAISRTHDVVYKNFQSPTSPPFSADFRNSVHSSFANRLRPEIVDGVLDIAENMSVCGSTSRKQSNELLVNNLLQFLQKSSFSYNADARTSVDPEATVRATRPEQTVPIAPSPSNCANGKKSFLGELKNPQAQNKLAPDVVMQEEAVVMSDPVTPDCLITKVVCGNSLLSAPELKPAKKVMSRRCRVLSADEEEIMLTDTGLKSNNEADENFTISSPVSRLNLIDSPCLKPSTRDFNIKRCNTVEEQGSKQDPIRVTEASPKPNVVGGSIDFRRRCNELAKQNDITYNKLMSNNLGGSVSVPVQRSLQNGPPEPENLNRQIPIVRQGCRKYRFLNYLMKMQSPPLQHNRKFPVSDEDIIHYAAIIELGHSAAHMKSMGVRYPEVHCNYQSLGESLKPEGEVDNFLLTCFCRMLFKEKHPASSCRHYFFPIIGEAILKYQSYPNDYLIRTTFEGAAKASKGRNLGYVDNTLFFPIVDSHHWFVFAVDLKWKVFAFLDSFHDKKSDFHAHKKDLLIDNFIHLWEMFVSRDHNFGEFRAMYPNVPKQGTSIHDCGVFCMKFMERWKANVDLRRVFSTNDILNIRIQYAIKLFFQSQNDTDQSLVTGYYTKV